MTEHKKKAEQTWRNIKERKNDPFFKDTKNTIYESTKAFVDFIKINIKDKNICILDCACGNGTQANYISKKILNRNFFGYDINQYLISQASNSYPKINWFVHDCYKKIKIIEKIDFAYSLQTLSILPNGYKKHFESIKNLNPKYFAGSLLLWDGDGSYTVNININRGAFIYHYYNLDEFKSTLKKLGYKKIIIEKFNIKKTLAKNPNIKGPGTYTIKNNKKNLQISGPLIMKWYFFLAKRN
jgi:SAM-dependent methyltransferase